MALNMLLVAATVLTATVRSCGGSSTVTALPLTEYCAYVEDKANGLHVEKTVGEYVFDVQYKPLDYVVAQQQKSTQFTQHVWDSLKTQVSDMQYYTFRIGTVSGKDITKYNLAQTEEFYARLQYFALDMQNDLQLIEGKDTLPCLMFHYERTYGVDPRAAFVVGFDNKRGKKQTEPITDRRFVFNDRTLGTGIVQMRIDATSFQQLPTLALK
jgi:hypothetical protein